jgi:hypothetical protein
MLPLLLAFQIAAILTLRWGAVPACGFVLPRVGVATVAAPWCGVTVLFAVETVVGLGSLRGLTTVAWCRRRGDSSQISRSTRHVTRCASPGCRRWSGGRSSTARFAVTMHGARCFGREIAPWAFGVACPSGGRRAISGFCRSGESCSLRAWSCRPSPTLRS